MSEKLCLQWNDFKDNVNTAFGSLREDCDFADVTLACEDGQQIEAHKVFLAASSPFFQKLLKINRHPHPLIFMRGIKSEDLVAIVDFLYCGEANVYQESLDSFLGIAEELELKGLMGGPKNNEETDRDVQKSQMPSCTDDKKANVREPKNVVPLQKQNNFGPKTDEANKIVALQNNISEDLQELSLKVKSLMQKSEHGPAVGGRLLYICKICGKDGQHTQVRNHIEANHIEGSELPCNLCGKIFRSRNVLEKHKYNKHK